jgi:hypothetical protein
MSALRPTSRTNIIPIVLAFSLVILVVTSSAAPTIRASSRLGSVGVSVHSFTTTEADLLEHANVRWVRADVAELSNGYSFAEIVANAKSRGIKILGILDIWTMNWDWNFTLDDWEQAVTMNVARHKIDVDAWEIWNEPGYPSNPMTAERYLAMLQIAYSIIKEQSPNSKVIMGGGLHLNTGWDPWLGRDEAFARRLSELGADHYADGISLHAYPWTNQVTNWVWATYDKSLQFYKSLFRSSLEVWITETGYPAQGGAETSQAAYLTEAFSFFGARSVNALFWYEMRDTPYSNPTATFGLLTDTLTPRPAYYSLQTLLASEE